MAKYLVETYYTCTFKVNHYLDDINETELKNLEKRDDGKFEVLDVKLDNRKTKSLDPKNNKVFENNKVEVVTETDKKNPISKESIITSINTATRSQVKDLACLTEEKDIFKKLLLVTTKFTCILENMKTEKLEKYLLIQVKKVSLSKL